MAWHSEVAPLLTKGNYPAIIEFYEAQIAQEPENISLYWYLGLAYLLSEQSAEAAGTWLSVFTEGDEATIDAWTKELVAILNAEALHQVELQNHQLAWLIRQQILELAPDSLENILRLIQSEISLQRYQPHYFIKDKEVIELLTKSEPGSVDSDLVLQVLKDVLQFPNSSSVDFARAVFNYHQDKQAIAITINEIADHMAYEQRYVDYSLDLNKILLDNEPDNLAYHTQRFWYFSKIEAMDQALLVAEEFQRRAHNVLTKVYASYLLLHIIIRQANWSRVMDLAEGHKQLIKDMTSEKPLLVPRYLKDYFIVLAQPLLYIEDNPKENRSLFNEIGRLYHNSTRQIIGNPDLLEPQLKHKPHQRLRIGYIAHTLRMHSVGWLSRWLFQYHDRDEFEIFIYLVNQSEEEFTKTWFTSKADRLYCFYRDSKSVIRQIKDDEIDILVELDSVTMNITCHVMCFKPAPIQVTWLGLDASGLPAIDYFIADPYVVPDDADTYYREKIWRLPQTYLGIDGFEVGIPDLRRDTLGIPSDAIIYLNIQNALKRHPHTLDLQMQIIGAVPNSYFLTKGSGDLEIIKRVFTEAALRHGVSPDRLRFLPFTPDEETHRANLAIADVILDTYPYNGATTTLEVLWMGIPLVTRVGEQFAARNSYAFMQQVGLNEGIAWTDEEYVEWGIKLGTDANLRQQIRWKLHQSRQTSPLWNARQFTRDMEEAYRQMWAKYSAERSL
ncbi:O-linked N-acetylglucosamine transferase [Gloeocapsa sp. PCC 73106]|uniref:O-linked N-acetylglucosamine transferase, SPINDLY family protein n=1 Tax=Gloeocapsa sp. PCC 73106 TaxID=102232 RepID=UPI0002ABCDA5|nr:O-linked N-acetylglucosamine transferase [Gloeocapsa sp. PCC 73106]ELR98803.1 putative O-linked N-acetylglucosamine transferase, SPINDLY family [Gloeocapsa sp. PCC 73106]